MERKTRVQLHQTRGQFPICNIKSTLVVCEGTDYVFLFGGFDEMDNLDSNVYLLNLKHMQWEVDDSFPGLYREGHSATYVGGGKILVFGGVPYDEFPDSVNSIVSTGRSEPGVRKDCSMLYYNVFDRRWSEVPAEALVNAPSPRFRHACCLSEDSKKLYVSGGMVDSASLDDIHCFDINSGTWSPPVKFVSRFDHHITIHDNRIYAFGGLDKDMNHVIDSIVFLDLIDGSVGEFNMLRYPTRGNNIFKPFTGNDFMEEEMQTEGDNDTSFDFVGSELIHLDVDPNSSYLLNVGLPRWNSSSRDVKLTRFDFRKIQSTNILDDNYLSDIFNKSGSERFENYVWKHAFVSNSLYLLGSFSEVRADHVLNSATPNQYHGIGATNDPVEETENGIESITENFEIDHENNREILQNFNSHLTHLLRLDLSSLGVDPIHSDILASSPQYSKDFERLLLEEDFTDFVIYTSVSEECSEYNNDGSDSRNLIKNHDRRIKVHKSILMARWPHFKRLIESGMNEAVNNEMFIPEPYKWIKALIFFLYTGSTVFDKYVSGFSAVDYSGLLVLSNMYELEQLRGEVISIMFRKIDLLSLEPDYLSDSLIHVWKNLLLVNEIVVLEHVIHRLKLHWRYVIRSNAFEELPKQLIIRLCQECSASDFISNPLDGSLSPKLRANLDTDEFESTTPAKRNSSNSFLFLSPSTPNESVMNDSPEGLSPLKNYFT